jgi:hypothetical protein
VTGLVVALAAGQSFWYGYARERLYADRSPRGMVRELLAMPGVDPSRLATFEFETPAIDFYAGQHAEAYGDTGAPPSGGHARTLEDLRARLPAGSPPMIVLARKAPLPGSDPRPAIERLRDAGLRAEPVSLRSRFTIDNRHSEVVAVRVERHE